MARLAHAVFALALGGAVSILRGKLVTNLDVQITPVLVVGLDVEVERDLLTLLDGENIIKVEDGLLPVGILGVRTGREANGLVAGGEVDVEP